MPRITQPEFLRALQVIYDETKTLRNVRKQLGASFLKAIDLLGNCQGRVVVTGIGKSGLVGRKIAATLSSTGTPAFFMHAGDASHGDLGAVSSHDIVLALSNSGTTAELLSLIPILRSIRVKFVAIVGNKASPLARAANVVIEVAVDREACSMNLAPTSSTIAMMAIGDALAVVLSERKKFGREDFAVIHAGGALGQKLRTVADLLSVADTRSCISSSSGMSAIARALATSSVGALNVISDGRRRQLVGIIVRMDIQEISKDGKRSSVMRAADIMRRPQIVLSESTLCRDAVEKLRSCERDTIVSLIDARNRPVGLLRQMDFLRALNDAEGTSRQG